MNTVQREPRSTGPGARRALAAKVRMSVFMVAAKVWRKDPQPDEQASFTAIESMAPEWMRRYFISWPPISMMEVTSGSRNCAAR